MNIGFVCMSKKDELLSKIDERCNSIKKGDKVMGHSEA